MSDYGTITVAGIAVYLKRVGEKEQVIIKNKQLIRWTDNSCKVIQ